VNEREFTDMVIDLAKVCKWMVVHFRPARMMRNGRESWGTAIQGDKGFPDLVVARAGVVLHCELKTSFGKLGQGQPEWAKEIGSSYRLWRPQDWDAIVKELSK
jgi:hypothetical protein